MATILSQNNANSILTSSAQFREKFEREREKKEATFELEKNFFFTDIKHLTPLPVVLKLKCCATNAKKKLIFLKRPVSV